MPMIRAAGADLFYDLAGPADAPVVAFSNSLGTTHAMWDAVVAALSGRYRCLRYDTRGHGRSPATGPVTIESLADDLAGLLDALGIARAHVVGLSLGGMIAQALAARRPDRVDRLVLVATAAHLAPPEAWHERARLVRAQGMGAIVDAVLGRWFTPGVTPERVEPVRKAFLATDPEGYAACCEAIAAMDLRGALGAIRAPTLVVAGADDPATPPVLAEAIRAGIPGAEKVVLPAAHLIAVERPEALAAHLSAFLDRAPRAEPDGGAPTRTGRVASFPEGLANRKAVLGAEHVERSLARAGPFATPWQDFITRAAWGEVWGDPTLPWKTRSLLTLALMVALNREEEFKLHVRPALRNGVTLAELRALLHHAAIYAGVPAANGAFRWVRDVLGNEADGVE